ncbi:hypothetical protein ACT4R9_00270 [Ornithobacterium rhinotracheale]|uniref:hypothetical protein n=1 Tax=Ornithobacterium rhinotracheale TaxID=28251 RepID=UPI003FA46A24
MIYKLPLLILLLFNIPVAMQAQQKECVYVIFEKDQNNIKREYEHSVFFIISPQLDNIEDRLCHSIKKNKKEKIPYDKVKHKLITKKELNQKLKNKLKSFSPPLIKPDFNDFFQKIYVYDMEEQTLYEVHWLNDFS